MYSNKQRFQGIIPPIITPLTRERALDEDALCRLIDFDLDSGCAGVFCMGSSGEATMTSREVWRQTLRATLRHVGARGQVFCGVIDTSTARVIENIRVAEELGATAMVVTPAFYLQNVSQDEIVRHYEAVARSTNAEIVAYSIPAMTHVVIAPETMRRIAEIDNVVAFKDSGADWERFQRYLYLLEDRDIALFNGAEELCAAAMLFGAQGCVPGLANFFPKPFVDMYRAAREGDIPACHRLQRQVWEIRAMLSVGRHWMSAMKHIGARMGFGADIASLPVEPLTPEEARRLDAMLEPHL